MAKIPLGPDPTSVKIRVKVYNAASTVGAGLTGLAHDTSGLQVSVIQDDSDTAVVYAAAAGNIETIATIGTWAAPTSGKCRFRAVDPTNHPGLYELHFADALLAGCSSAVVTLKGAANMVETDVELDCSTLQGTKSEILGEAVPGSYAAGTLGYVVGTNLDAPVSDAATPADILGGTGDPITTNASGQVVASSVEGAVAGAVASVAGDVDGNVAGSVLGSVADIGAAGLAGVLAQIAAYFSAATAEPTAPPSATGSLIAKLLWSLSKEITGRAGTSMEERRLNAAGVVVGKAAVTKVGGVTTRAAFTPGP